MRSATRAALLAAVIALPGLPPVAATDEESILEPASSGGLAAVDRALARLSTHRRLLVVGAHPDDEDNQLLTWVARGLGGEAAYFSLSRGEGGQNLIGPELGVGLGVVRTGELLAARRIEGSRQLFARAYDFGYTRSLSETLRRWPRELLQEDAVRAVRRFKPQVIVAVFPPDTRAGHGQHQASAVIAEDAFRLAGEAESFSSTGSPWRPRGFYRRAWSREGATLGYSLAGLDPMTGRSIGQLAAASRSQHRSQDMGREQRLGPGQAGLVWLAGEAGEGGDDPFAGIDTRLAAIAEGLEEGTARSAIAELLERVERRARDARRRLAPVRLAEAATALALIVADLRGAIGLLPAGGESAAQRAVLELLREKEAIAEAALLAAAGVVVDAIADPEVVAPGGLLEAELLIWNAGDLPLRVAGVRAESPAGWSAEERKTGESELAPGELGSWRFAVTVPVDAEPTLPYFLARPLAGDLYDWGDVGETTRGEPYGPEPLGFEVDLVLGELRLSLERSAVYRTADQAVGEIRRPLRAVPAVEVAVTPALLLRPAGAAGVGELEVALHSNRDKPVRGRVELALPEGWPPVPPLPFTIAQPRGSEALRFSLPLDAPPGSYRIEVAAVVEDGYFASALPLIDYPHIRPTPIEEAAAVAVRVLDLELPSLGSVAYVPGASDRVPGVLRNLGLSIELLDGRALGRRDLAAFDAVIVGSRAYETDADVAAANGRLLDYVRGGGLAIVQYQQYQFASGGFAPYPLEIARPHDRVTDEGSPVRLLAPEHPVFQRPNPIAAADWEGWVQERGLYFAGTWDDAYTPLLALTDPDQPETRGALLVAELGAGTYVYTGLSFFRQLPAGVPGAIRLFVNLLGLAE